MNILAPQQRFEVTNYKNVMIPTNIDVSPQMKDKFAAFYTALFDRTVEKNPGAVITEYAWQATTCDPCPGPALNTQELQTLGADVLDGAKDQPTAYQTADFVLTRLHARYGKTITDDLRFKQADAIAGGREHPTANGKIEEGWEPAPVNNFQGRYAIRHGWTGPITCEKPQRARWGGPPREVSSQPGFIATGVTPAVDLAFAPRGEIELAKVVRRDVPELGITAAASTIAPPAAGGAATQPSRPGPTPTPSLPTSKPKSGCGCGTAAQPGSLLVMLGLAFALRRRRR